MVFVFQNWGDSALSGLLEECVGADTAPHDVWLTVGKFIAVLEGGSAVGGPGHLEHPRRSLNALDPQALAERARTLQILDELLDGHEERSLLGWAESLEVRAKLRQPCIGRHGLSGFPATPGRFGDRSQPLDKRRARAERLHATGLAICVGRALACLPGRRPEPCLGRVDDLLRPQEDTVFGDLGVEQVAFLEMCPGADLLGQRQLSLRSKRRSCHDRILLSESKNYTPHCCQVTKTFRRKAVVGRLVIASAIQVRQDEKGGLLRLSELFDGLNAVTQQCRNGGRRPIADT